MSVRPSPDGYLEVEDGGNWRRLRLISDVTFSPTPAPETSETTLDEGEVTTIGSPGFPTYSVTVNVNDASKAYRILEDAFYSKASVNLRQVTGTLAVNAAAPSDNTQKLSLVGATGIVTGAGGLDFGSPDSPNSPWVPGRLLNIGRKIGVKLVADDVFVIIEEILTSSTMRVTRVGKVTNPRTASFPAIVTPDNEALADAEASENWHLVDYAVLDTWVGRVTQAGAPSRSGTTRNETIQGNCESRPNKRFLVQPAGA